MIADAWAEIPGGLCPAIGVSHLTPYHRIARDAGSPGDGCALHRSIDVGQPNLDRLFVLKS